MQETVLSLLDLSILNYINPLNIININLPIKGITDSYIPNLKLYKLSINLKLKELLFLLFASS